MPLYRGRIAPTPSGELHLGHGRTFWYAFQRARAAGGRLILRIEDLDAPRCRPEYTAAALRDLRWLGIAWGEGPDVGGSYAPYTQSARLAAYQGIWRRLCEGGFVYPSPHSRRDVAAALSAPHEEDDHEPLFPAALRPPVGTGQTATEPGEMNWRFRVPDGRAIAFHDARQGSVTRTTGSDFGDFLVWRKDGFPSYELAVTADDHAMAVTEVVRGADLLTSTARQIMLYEALSWSAPEWCHCDLVRDESGKRLAKRAAALSLRSLREQGVDPVALTAKWDAEWGVLNVSS